MPLYMLLNNTEVQFQLDCGATIDILPLDTYYKVFDEPQCDGLVKTATTLVMFNKTELLPLGKCCVEVTNAKTKEKFNLAYLVVKKGLKSLLGAPTIQLKLMTVNKENILSIGTLTQTAMIDMHADVFEGEGKLEDCTKPNHSPS